MTKIYAAGRHIRSARRRLGISQSALAEKLAVSQPTVAHWEAGSHAPRQALVPRLAALLELPREDLTERSGDAAAPTLSPFSTGFNFKRPVRHVPVFAWPHCAGDLGAIVSGTMHPVAFFSLSSPGDAPIAMLLEDPDAASEFPPGSIGLLDLADRTLRDGQWYVFEIDGTPAARIWRAAPANDESGTKPSLHPERLFGKPFGRIVLTMRPY